MRMNRFDKVFQESKQPNSLDKAQKSASASAATTPLPARMLDCEIDPRPDLEADHPLWVALLTVANERKDDPGLFGTIHALRCGGAALERDKDFGMLIRPGEWQPAEYETFKAKHLASRKAEVVQLLKAAAARLPQAQKDSLKARIAARVKAIEAKALALGWTRDELWAEKDWDDPRDGRCRESLYKALMESSQTWGNAELGQITAEYAEIFVPGPGLDTREPVRLKHYRLSPAVKLLSESPTSQPSATSKKEAV